MMFQRARPSAGATLVLRGRPSPRHGTVRTIATATAATTSSTTTAAQGKPVGDISNAFASLSNKQWAPLEPRFAALKQSLCSDPAALHASWSRLLDALAVETAAIKARGSSVVPEIPFESLSSPPESFTAEHRKRGVAVIRGVLPPAEALALKADLRFYIAANRDRTKAFPKANPQVYELYWSPSQLRARAHPRLLVAQRFLMSHWHAPSASTRISTRSPVAYADRLRMRLPGDNAFALGPHVDGGSCERWEPEGYGRAGTYNDVFAGRWERYDPWDAERRLDVVSDLYGGSGACSAFRMYQGWLSMSETGPGEGTLLVNPLLGLATSYFLLRPFFRPLRSEAECGSQLGTHSAAAARERFLAADNWAPCGERDSWLHGASPGHGQELRAQLHPHLELDASMVHVPRVRPGDYVAWHCDAIHAVDQVHRGASDSSVLYIPACPLTEANARYLARQRRCFVDGVPSPDFPGGEGERGHAGRWGAEQLAAETATEPADDEGLKAMGLRAWEPEADGLTEGEREVMNIANKELGFYG